MGSAQRTGHEQASERLCVVQHINLLELWEVHVSHFQVYLYLQSQGQPKLKRTDSSIFHQLAGLSIFLLPLQHGPQLWLWAQIKPPQSELARAAFWHGDHCLNCKSCDQLWLKDFLHRKPFDAIYCILAKIHMNRLILWHLCVGSWLTQPEKACECAIGPNMAEELLSAPSDQL